MGEGGIPFCLCGPDRMKPAGDVRCVSGCLSTQVNEIFFPPIFGKRLNLRQTKLECYLKEGSKRAAPFSVCFSRQ